MKDIRLSFLLHALVLLVALTFPVMQGGSGPDKEQRAGTKDEPIDVTIVEPPKKEDAPVVEEDVELEALKKRAPHAGDDCEKWYGGIGIIDGVDGVSSVYPGYPAALAGIQVGDIITSDEPIRGEVGTPVTVTVLRGMRTFVLEMVRDKICVA